MHRVSVFRDDVVFLLYMLQRRWYPVDMSRPAEGYDDADGGSGSGAVDGPALAPSATGTGPSAHSLPAASSVSLAAGSSVAGGGREHADAVHVAAAGGGDGGIAAGVRRRKR